MESKPMSDSEFLEWIADRLVYVHKENTHMDYILRLRRIAINLRAHEQSIEGRCEQWREDSHAIRQKGSKP